MDHKIVFDKRFDLEGGRAQGKGVHDGRYRTPATEDDHPRKSNQDQTVNDLCRDPVYLIHADGQPV